MVAAAILFFAASLIPLYLKYRIVLTGERCKAKITGIAEQSCGCSIGGAVVKKNAYLVRIGGKRYHTAHGCLFLALGKKNIGKEIWVYHSPRYGNEVFKCFDLCIEILSLLCSSAGAAILLEVIK